jgi:hypothetical protein
MEEQEWERIRSDYHERMRIAKEEGIKHEKQQLDDIFKHLEVKDLTNIRTTGELHIDILIICGVDADGSGMLVSRKWDEPLCHLLEIFKYEKEANQRDTYYKMIGNENDDNRYEQWLDYVSECEVMTGKTNGYYEEILSDDIEIITEKVIKKVSEIVEDVKIVEKPKRKYSEGEDDEEDDIEEDEDGNIIRNDEELQLDDEFDDTFAEAPEEYLEQLASVNGMDKEAELQKKEEPEDEWGF